MRAESIVDLGNVSLAIGSQLISDPSSSLRVSHSPLLRCLHLCGSLFLPLSLSLLLPRCVFIRRPFPSRSFSPRSPPRLAHVRRDNSYVLRMHNVPNYFTLLLLRVINARRLARARAPVPGVFREIYCSEITRVRTRRRPTLGFSLSPCLPPSSFPLRCGRAFRGVSYFRFFQLSAITAVHGAKCTRPQSRVFTDLPFFFPRRVLSE